MELRTYIEIFWRRLWIILITVVVMIIGAIIATYAATPTYVSSTTLRVTTVGADASNGRPDIVYTERLMNTYARIATGRQLYAELTERFNLQARPQISVDTVPNTELMTIQVTANSPEIARDVANATAEVIIARSLDQFSGGGQSRLEILSRQLTQIEEELTAARQQYDTLALRTPGDQTNLDAAKQSIDLKERTYANLLTQYEAARIDDALRENSIYVIEAAVTPNTPSSPREEVNIVLGLLVGLLAGVALALVRENLDTRLHTKQQVDNLAHSPIIGEIPGAKEPLPLIHSPNNSEIQVEAFRRLRINLLRTHPESLSQTVLVTSAEANEGKSSIAANLAITMAQTGRRVALIDCNLHKPALHQLFNLSHTGGLMDVLLGQATIAGVLKESTFPKLKIITSGPKLTDLASQMIAPAIIPKGLADQLSQGPELLGSPSMASVLKQLQQEFDIVILDTPALLSVSDALVLVPMTDTVVLIVARGRSRRYAVRSTHQQLLNIGAKSIQLVLNRA